jgi:hypothetical protein
MELLTFSTNIRFHEEQEPIISKGLGEESSADIYM